MMVESTSLRRKSDETSDPDHPLRETSRRSSLGIRRVAWELFMLLGLVAVTGYLLERSGTQDCGSDRVMILGEHSGSVRSIEFVRGTSNLVSLDTTGESWLWDTTTCRVLSAMGGPAAAVSSQALDARGRALATGGRDGTIAIWDLATGERQIHFTSARGPIRALAFSCDGKTIAVSEEDSVILLDPSTRRVRFTLQGKRGVVTALSFSPDGRALASASRDLSITLWDTATGQGLGFLQDHSDPIYSIVFAPDGKTLASVHAGGIVRIWDMASQRTRGVLNGSPHSVFVVAFAADGKTMATGHGRGIIVLWDADTLQERATLQESAGEVHALAFSPDGQTLVSGGSDSMLRLWELRMGVELGQVASHAPEISGSE
jgi:WD40 repeat protein